MFLVYMYRTLILYVCYYAYDVYVYHGQPPCYDYMCYVFAYVPHFTTMAI